MRNSAVALNKLCSAVCTFSGKAGFKCTVHAEGIHSLNTHAHIVKCILLLISCDSKVCRSYPNISTLRHKNVSLRK